MSTKIESDSGSIVIGKMEKLAVVLSLPRQNKYNALPEVERTPALPINALPGWETIPLHSKLPMLKCPDNQVIFSKNKIGRSHESTQRDFDSVCLNAKMDYNPLHDPHLRRFYSNEKLLKRLRDNGEITQNNDVICTLKEFNEHRIPLHETYLSLIRIERRKLNEEKQDHKMIAHAEMIANMERKMGHRKQDKKKGGVHQRKEELSAKRAQWIQTLRLRSQRKQQQIESMKAIREVVLRHKKELHDFRIQHRLDVGLDIQRKRLIALKKHLQFKSDRLKTNIKFLKENASAMAKEKARLSWEMHLKERTIKHKHVLQITEQTKEEMEEWIKHHMEKYRKKWNEIQNQLESKAHKRPKIHKPKRKQEKRSAKRSTEKSDDDNLKNLTSEDIHDALQTAVDLENPEYERKYDENDCIYKAAKFILEGILAKFDKDLSGDKFVQGVLENRIDKLFVDVKHYVMKRAAQIIATTDDQVSKSSCGDKRISIMSKSKRYSLSRFVGFNSFSALIGKGSYALSEDSVKMTGERTPTPAGSLTSVPIEPDDHVDDVLLQKQRPSLHVLTRDEQIFIEHLFIKFKRQLIVGIGRQVLAAIECHRNNKILNVRKELQDINRGFLVKVMARSILSFAINNCNFYSNSLLCQYALAGEIILSLQESLLKPDRDPRSIVQPRSRCLCRVPVPMASHCK